MKVNLKMVDFQKALKAYKKLAMSNTVTFFVKNNVLSIISNGLTYFRYNIFLEDSEDGIVTIPDNIFQKLDKLRGKSLTITKTKNEVIINSGSKITIYSLKTNKNDLKLQYKGDGISISAIGVVTLKNLLSSLKFNPVGIDYKGIPITIHNTSKYIKICCADTIHFVELTSKSISKDEFKFNTDLKWMLSIFNSIDDDKAIIRLSKAFVVVISETLTATAPIVNVGVGNVNDAVAASALNNFNKNFFSFDKDIVKEVLKSTGIITDSSDVMNIKSKGNSCIINFITKSGKSKDKITLENTLKFDLDVPFLLFREMLDNNDKLIKFRTSKNEKMYMISSTSKTKKIKCVGPLC